MRRGLRPFLLGICVSASAQALVLIAQRHIVAKSVDAVSQKRPNPSLPEAVAAFSVPTKNTVGGLGELNSWKLVFAEAKVLNERKDPLLTKDVGLRSNSRAFYTLVKWPKPTAEADTPYWPDKPLDCINAVKLYEGELTVWADEEWLTVTEASKTAVKYRRETITDIVANQSIDTRLSSYILGLLSLVDDVKVDAETILNDFTVNLDKRWEALYSLDSRASEETINTKLVSSVNELAYNELAAGSNISSLYARTSGLKEPLKQQIVYTGMEQTARFSPYELSSFLTELPPGAPMRIAGIQMLLANIDKNSPEAAAWSIVLEKEKPQ